MVLIISQPRTNPERQRTRMFSGLKWLAMANIRLAMNKQSKGMLLNLLTIVPPMLYID